ncbi:MAG: hypothetical protein KF901_18250 [Myxococcales bacterium]|nr:hypothetical protein [Myxococcales bacterium]
MARILAVALLLVAAHAGAQAPGEPAPSPERPSPERPSPEAPSPERPSPEAPSPERPSPERPSPEAPSPEAPSPEGPSEAEPPPRENDDPLVPPPPSAAASEGATADASAAATSSTSAGTADTAAAADAQHYPTTPELMPPTAAMPLAEGLEAEFGRGITLRSDDGDFSLTVRGRIQARAAFTRDLAGEEPADAFAFLIRRMRLVFLGHLGSPKLLFYIQLGFAPGDLEPGYFNPIRDAVITWMPTSQLGVQVGQTKVPFNRERVISSSALQLVDRSIVNAALNLDRDIGIQLFSNDLFGLGGYIGAQLGVYSGNGRNRINRDLGLLYVARLQVQPTGRFDDAYAEADLLRTRTPRFSIGAGFAYNHRTHRENGTHGAFFQLDEGFDVFHAEADVAFKWNGFSLLAELLWRRARADTQTGVVDGVLVTERFGSAFGYTLQAGYFVSVIELAARFAEIRPTHEGSAMPTQRELLGGVGWYIHGHNLKLQADYGVLFGDRLVDVMHQARVQLQLFY